MGNIKINLIKMRNCWKLAASEKRVQAQCVDLKSCEQNDLQKEEWKNPLNVDSDKNYDQQLSFTR